MLKTGKHSLRYAALLLSFFQSGGSGAKILCEDEILMLEKSERMIV
jgi:hypothetical protein